MSDNIPIPIDLILKQKQTSAASLLQQNDFLKQLNNIENQISCIFPSLNKTPSLTIQQNSSNSDPSLSCLDSQNLFSNTLTQIDLTNYLNTRDKNSNNNMFNVLFSTPNTLPVLSQLHANSDPDKIEKDKIFQILQQNSVLLNQVISNFEHTNKTISITRVMVDSIQESSSPKNETEQIIPILPDFNPKGEKANKSNPSARSLFKHFFGNQKAYQYGLSLDSKIPNPIHKGKKMILSVKLIDLTSHEVVKNKNKIILSFSLHTWQIPSKQILNNKVGNKAVGGQTEIELLNGEATFASLQINEVTSKFINNHILILIIPSKPGNHTISLGTEKAQENYIDHELIKPLMIEKVVVKSIKKKRQKNIQEDDDNEED